MDGSWRWWSGRAGAAKVDLVTRWQLYVPSASEPLVALLVVLGQPGVAVSGGVFLLVASAAHTLACLRLLHRGVAFLRSGPRPPGGVVAAALALTLVGPAAALAAFPGTWGAQDDGFHLGAPMGVTILLFCAAVTAAATPLLSERQLLTVICVPTAVAGILQLTIGNPGLLWAVNYLLVVGAAAGTYRFSLWLLGVLWELDRARAVQWQLAVADERLRFARDLHDVLGRNLALIAVSSELAARLLDRGEDGASERLRQVRQVAQDSMQELREVVGGYRTADLGVELAGAQAVLRSAGISVRITGDDAAGLEAGAQAALAWVVREAVTNVLRHSEATAVTITVATAPDVGTDGFLVLRIENDGVRDAAHAPGSPSDGRARPGTGLAGLRERLAGVRGELVAETLPHGRFSLQVRLPLGEGVPPATVVQREALP
jgi:two-component system sensor histidine kinase DesK